MIKHTFTSDIGPITLTEENNKIVEISFQKENIYKDSETETIKSAITELKEYLDGKRQEFSFPYEITGTNFQLDVLKAMKSVSFGKTISYSKLAEQAGYIGASRTVGTVCRKNKLPLLFPCHRVIRQNGDIGHYAGGKKLKKALLEIEKEL